MYGYRIDPISQLEVLLTLNYGWDCLHLNISLKTLTTWKMCRSSG